MFHFGFIPPLIYLQLAPSTVFTSAMERAALCKVMTALEGMCFSLPCQVVPSIPSPQWISLYREITQRMCSDCCDVLIPFLREGNIVHCNVCMCCAIIQGLEVIWFLWFIRWQAGPCCRADGYGPGLQGLVPIGSGTGRNLNNMLF